MAGFGQPYSWRIGLRLAESLSAAQLRFLDAATRLQQLTRPESVDSEIRVKRIWQALGVGTAIALVYILLGVFHRVDWRTAGPVAAVAFLVGFVVSFRSFVNDIRERFRLVHAYESGIDEMEETARAFGHYSREVLRLSSVYWQYQQWTPVLAGILHDPFAGALPVRERPEATVITDSPKSTRVGTAEPNPVKLEALTNQARHHIFTRGWTYRCWEAAIASISGDFRSRNAIDAAVDPFDENLRQRTGLLEYLRAGFEHGAYGAASRKDPVESTGQLITSSGLGSLTTTVLVDGMTPYPDPSAPAGADPADGLFRELVPSAADGPFAASLWRKHGLGASVDVHRRIVAMEREWSTEVAPTGSVFIDAYPIRQDGQLIFAAARVDLSEPCSPTELIMFEDIEEASANESVIPIDPEGD
jgi:hypothetical protein